MPLMFLRVSWQPADLTNEYYRRSRGEYITAPTSASPTGSQHFDHADPFESQNEDETTTTVAAQSTSVDTPTTSKRRASGTRAMDSRRGRYQASALHNDASKRSVYH